MIEAILATNILILIIIILMAMGRRRTDVIIQYEPESNEEPEGDSFNDAAYGEDRI